MKIKRLSVLLGSAAVVLGTATTFGMAGANADTAATNGPATSAVCGHRAGPHCLAIRNNVATARNKAAMAKGDAPQGLGPADIQAAYNLKGGKQGGTVALIEAGDYKSIDADLQTYRKTYNLPECSVANKCLSVVNQDGAPSPLPAPDDQWAGETALDVDAVSAACPSCKILVVEANEPQDPNDVVTLIKNLSAGNDTAAKLKANAASNSWGDKPDKEKYYKDVEGSYNHPGMAITVSSGDDGNGGGVTVPSSYPTITAVGGTSLTKDSSPRGWKESAWNGAGSGCSDPAPQPDFQKQAVGDTCKGKRGVSDVSAVADPNTGLAVYQGGQWQVTGGTSLSSPLVAAIYTMAGDTDGVKDASKAYANADKLNDVTDGNNGSCQGPVCNAGKGWDGPTGLGTPNGLGAF